MDKSVLSDQKSKHRSCVCMDPCSLRPGLTGLWHEILCCQNLFDKPRLISVIILLPPVLFNVCSVSEEINVAELDAACPSLLLQGLFWPGLDRSCRLSSTHVPLTAAPVTVSPLTRDLILSYYNVLFCKTWERLRQSWSRLQSRTSWRNEHPESHQILLWLWFIYQLKESSEITFLTFGIQK